MAEPAVVAIPTPHPLWLREIVLLGDTLAGYLGHHVHQLVDGYQLVSSQVERAGIVGAHDAVDALHAVVHVHERTSLLPISPNLYLVSVSGQSHLTADRRRSLLFTPLVGTQRAIDVVETDHAGLEAVVLVVV